MLRVNQLIGFGVSRAPLLVGGTAIGDMTDGGGLASAFDGVTNQAFAISARKLTSASGYNNFLGLDWGASVSRTVSSFELFAPNDSGILGGGGTALVRLEGSPDNSAWTVLYTTPSAIGASGTVENVTSGIITSVAYRYHRIAINGNGVNGTVVAELRFYGF